MVGQAKKIVLQCLCYIAGMALLQTAAVAAGGTPNADLQPEPALFSEAAPCSQCHDNLEADREDVENEDISFVRHWQTTMMRFSFLDPFWRAKVRAESLRLPLLSAAIEEKCSRCHAPMANEQALQDGEPVFIFGEGGFDDSHSPYNLIAMDGVSCTLCHQITPFADGSDETSVVLTYSNSGAFGINDSRVAFGKYYPDFAEAMEKVGGFRPVYSTHLDESEFCAVCHDLYTDYFDKDGVKQSTPTTLFPEQTPYQEWLASEYPVKDGGTSCQDCHMLSYDEARIAEKPRVTVNREFVFSHTFLTENTMMLNIIASIAEQQGVEIPDLEEAVADGQRYLASAGGIEIVDTEWNTKELMVTLKVTNAAGHKLPTSIPVRRVFIHFAVYEGDREDGEAPIFSSGDTNAEGGIIGVDDVEQTLGYEPHYLEITEEDEVQVYEGVMETLEGEVTQTLLRAAAFVKDNRILPRGWKDDLAPLEIFPKGNALADTNFMGGEDTIVYRVPGRFIKDRKKLTIEAELKDQTLSFPMVHDLEDVQTSDATGTIGLFLTEYDHHKVYFELIGSDMAILEK